ncbi:hypothetical protein EMPG_13102, partial [Blastomyces silverae]
MRAQELLKIKHSNDSTTLRNILLHFDQVVLLNEYNKSEGIKDKLFVIARYLPEPLGRVVIAYLAELKPLRDFLLTVFTTVNLDTGTTIDHFLVPTLFSTPDNSLFTTEMVSSHMSHVIESELGVKVKMVKWRHLAIALYHMFLEERMKKMDQITCEELALIFQTGHSEETFNHHYALTTDMLIGTNDHTLRTFYSVSKSWHELLGLILSSVSVLQLSPLKSTATTTPSRS